MPNDPRALRCRFGDDALDAAGLLADGEGGAR